MSQYQRILTAVDDSAQRERVLATTAEFAALTGASVHVLHVDADAPGFDTDSDSEVSGAASRLVADAVQALQARGVRADGGIAHAADVDIDDVVLLTARDLDVQLIVLGANHRHGVRSWLEASVADEVAHRAEAPVLLVP